MLLILANIKVCLCHICKKPVMIVFQENKFKVQAQPPVSELKVIQM